MPGGSGLPDRKSYHARRPALAGEPQPKSRRAASQPECAAHPFPAENRESRLPAPAALYGPPYHWESAAVRPEIKIPKAACTQAEIGAALVGDPRLWANSPNSMVPCDSKSV